MAERTLKEYATPSTEEPQAIIVYPTVEGNNFEIKAHANCVFFKSPFSLFIKIEKFQTKEN